MRCSRFCLTLAFFLSSSSSVDESQFVFETLFSHLPHFSTYNLASFLHIPLNVSLLRREALAVGFCAGGQKKPTTESAYGTDRGE
jgi:hypothetical protein